MVLCCSVQIHCAGIQLNWDVSSIITNWHTFHIDSQGNPCCSSARCIISSITTFFFGLMLFGRPQRPHSSREEKKQADITPRSLFPKMISFSLSENECQQTATLNLGPGSCSSAFLFLGLGGAVAGTGGALCAADAVSRAAVLRGRWGCGDLLSSGRITCMRINVPQSSR